MLSQYSKQLKKLATGLMPIFLMVFAESNLLAQCVQTSETFPYQYNTGFSANINNGTFLGSSGIWTVKSNANGTAGIVTPYYSPSSTYAIKFSNWKTNGVSPSPSAPGAGYFTVTSPVINMTNPCCINGQVMQMTLWTYNVVNGDVNAKMAIDFSADGGTNWTPVFQKTSAQLFIDYGANTQSIITLPVGSSYNTNNFRYRFRGESNKNNSNNFYVFVDDISFLSPSSSNCHPLILGNLVWLDASNNGSLDTGEKGIAGISVDMYDNAGTIIQSTLTDSNGNYQFNNLSSGTYSVGAILMNGYTNGDISSANIYADNQNDAITTINGAARTTNFSLSSTTSFIDIGLKSVVSLGNSVWKDLNANGLMEAGEPGMDGITVNLYFDNNKDNIPDGGIVNKTVTSANGLYKFNNIAPGSYIVGILLPHKYSSSFIPVSGNNADNDVDIDNNGIYTADSVCRSNYVTLSIAGEPTVDGDGNNSNLTLDFGLIADVDHDGICDSLDIDDDNDGITDFNESGGYDPLGDGDGDGIKNYLDQTPGCNTPTGNDPWKIPYKPLVWMDCNGDGINDFFDWDRDGIINEMDLDSDNDGIVDSREVRDSNYLDDNGDGMIDGDDADKNGLMSSADNGNANPLLNGLKATDIDRDGTPNFLDLDSDGDGLTDINESFLVNMKAQEKLITSTDMGIALGSDSDEDGVRNEAFFGPTSPIIADTISVFGAKGIVPIDSDGDGIPNCYDIDSDNDGISDQIEGQSTCNYILPSTTDADSDGLMDCLETSTVSNCSIRMGEGILPADTDNDGTPDYLDKDSDNDGIPDMSEGTGLSVPFTPLLTDADNDGMPDQWDDFNILIATDNFINNVGNDQIGSNGNVIGLLPSGSNAQLPQSFPGSCPSTDRDWRNVNLLPVTIISFDGNLSGTHAKLYWVVEKENNLKQYDVERSYDGINFAKAGTVNALNNSMLFKYDFNDEIETTNGNKIFYRLRIINKDNSYKISDVISFTVKLNASITINPNPARNTCSLFINCKRNQVAPFTVADINGKMVLMTAIALSKGNNTIKMDELTKLPNGTYFVQLFTEEEKLTTQLIILH